MTELAKGPRLAVLIDADNASAKIAAELFEEIATIGKAIVRRIYGDFSKPNLGGWREALPTHAITAQQNFAYTSGKNASDIALVIDAMDLLHRRLVDGFCLVTSDSDFTRLATRLCEEGLSVYGFGEQKTPDSLKMACDRFIFTENLVKPGASNAAARKSPREAVSLIVKVMSDAADDDGWAALGEIGSRLAKIAPDFDPRTYGATKLSSLVIKSGAFETNTSKNHLYIKGKKATKT